MVFHIKDWLSKNLTSKRKLTVLNCISVIVLLAAIAYGGAQANYFFSNIQDDIVYPYLFDDYSRNSVVVPTNHSNLVKFPLFVIQASLPYNFFTLSLVNFSLLLLFAAGTVAFLTYLFGKKWFALINILLASLFVTSAYFNINIMETTIRNVEYPIGFAYMILLAVLYGRGVWSKKIIAWGLASILLMSVSIAGDTLLLYAFCVPALATITIRGLVLKRLRSQEFKVICVIIATILLAVLIRKFIAWSGVAIYFLSPQFEAHITSFELIWPSISQALFQLFKMGGGDIFDRSVGFGTSIFFVNLSVITIGSIGLFWMAKDHLVKTAKQADVSRSFLYMTTALCFVIVFAAYILAGQVVTVDGAGNYGDAHQERYITLLPVLLIAGFVYVVKKLYRSSTSSWIITAIVGVSLVLSVTAIRGNHLAYTSGAEQKRSTILKIVEKAKENNVDLLLSGDGYGGPLQFWSGDTLKYVSVTNCDQWFPYNTVLSWQKPSQAPIKSALVVDRDGLDSSYWQNCTDDKLQLIYGVPTKKVSINSIFNQKEPIQLWIYDRDIRSSVKPFSL